MGPMHVNKQQLLWYMCLLAGGSAAFFLMLYCEVTYILQVSVKYYISFWSALVE